jgi:hypothetical protein
MLGSGPELPKLNVPFTANRVVVTFGALEALTGGPKAKETDATRSTVTKAGAPKASLDRMD